MPPVRVSSTFFVCFVVHLMEIWNVQVKPFCPGGIVCASVVSLAFPALADVNEETLVVTASATEQSVKDAPASISVITQQDLQRKPVQNLKDVLRDVPGVQLTNEGDNRKGVSIRGLSSSYTLILVDGKRVNSRNAVFRHNDFDLNWIPVDAIERIEVVRGPMSSSMAPMRSAAWSTSSPKKSARNGRDPERGYHHSGTPRSR
jgi:outer membrane receptor for monomeric catechols